MPAEKITREKIIHAVLDCAFVNSVGGTSLADIAGNLGIKKASLYNHYESREAMLEDTLRYCSDYLKKVSLIPSEMEATAQKYTAEAVLKGIVHRWFKVNEKEPLLQIYSFIHSEKYFSTQALKITEECSQRLVEQTVLAFESLLAAGKIKSASKKVLVLRSHMFCDLLNGMLDSFIADKKNYIRLNPQTGEGELFNSLPFEMDYKSTDAAVEEFCRLLA